MGGARVAARAELACASYRTCSRQLARGEVKRVLQRGPLVGYFLACPACGYAAPYLDEDVGYREEPPAEEPLPAGSYRKLVGVERPPACARCRRLLRVEGGALEALDP